MTDDGYTTEVIPDSEEGAEYRGYEVTVMVPDEAPNEVIDTLFSAVAEASADIEATYPNRIWDLFVTGSPADHRTEAAFIRKVEECEQQEEALHELHTELQRLSDDLQKIREALTFQGTLMSTKIRTSLEILDDSLLHPWRERHPQL